MVHLPYASLANRTMMSPLGLDGETLGAFEEDLSFSQVQRLDHLLGGISLGYGSLEKTSGRVSKQQVSVPIIKSNIYSPDQRTLSSCGMRLRGRTAS